LFFLELSKISISFFEEIMLNVLFFCIFAPCFVRDT